MIGHSPAIPRHVTALYIYSIVSLLATLHFTLIGADVSINNRENKTLVIYRDLPATFGASLTREGITGYLVPLKSPDACNFDEINPPPHNVSGVKWIAIVIQGKCTFAEKVYNSQEHGYNAVIVVNNVSDALLHMAGGSLGSWVDIPSVFVGRTDGYFIADNYRYSRKMGFSVTLDNEGPLNMNYYLVPFAAVVGCCFLLMLVFMIGKWLRDFRHRHKRRISKKLLKTIPIKKFKKGDEYDLCAICLEEYDEGDKIRVLPCSHLYHCKCIDHWLTKSRGTCPVCKRKVFPNIRTDSESESDPEDTNERTPLLSDTNPSVSGHGSLFRNSGLPAGAVGGFVNRAGTSENDDTSSESSVPSPRFFIRGHSLPDTLGHVSHRDAVATLKDICSGAVSPHQIDCESQSTGSALAPDFVAAEKIIFKTESAEQNPSSTRTASNIPTPSTSACVNMEDDDICVLDIGNHENHDDNVAVKDPRGERVYAGVSINSSPNPDRNSAERV